MSAAVFRFVCLPLVAPGMASAALPTAASILASLPPILLVAVA